MAQTLRFIGMRSRDGQRAVEASRLAVDVRDVCAETNSCTVCACEGRRSVGPHKRGPFRFCDADVLLVVAIEKEAEPGHRFYDA